MPWGTVEGDWRNYLPSDVKFGETDYFSYPFLWTPIAALGAVPVSITVASGQHFVGLTLNGVVSTTTGLAAVAFPPLLVQIETSDGNKKYFNVPTQLQTVMGTGPNPGYLPQPLFVRATSTITVTLQNLDGVNGFNVYLTLGGAKLLFIS